jgi:uncharacterized membrane protein YjfL (UPF0719 family)
MATNANPANEQSIASLVGGIVDDAQTLIKQQFQLVRSEIKQELRQARNAAISLSVGALLAFLGVILLIVMAVHLLHTYTELQLWACYGIVGGLLAVLGAVLLYLGKEEAEDVQLLPPPQSAEAARENVQWLTGQTTSETR